VERWLSRVVLVSVSFVAFFLFGLSIWSLCISFFFYTTPSLSFIIISSCSDSFVYQVAQERIDSKRLVLRLPLPQVPVLSSPDGVSPRLSLRRPLPDQLLVHHETETRSGGSSDHSVDDGEDFGVLRRRRRERGQLWV